MKVRSCGFSVVFLLVAMLGGMGVTDVNDSNLSEYIASDCVAVADFIEGNFESLVQSFRWNDSEVVL